MGLLIDIYFTAMICVGGYIALMYTVRRATDWAFDWFEHRSLTRAITRNKIIVD